MDIVVFALGEWRHDRCSIFMELCTLSFHIIICVITLSFEIIHQVNTLSQSQAATEQNLISSQMTADRAVCLFQLTEPWIVFSVSKFFIVMVFLLC